MLESSLLTTYDTPIYVHDFSKEIVKRIYRGEASLEVLA